MQHVTAFSRPQTVPAVPAAATRRNLWILSTWRDLILYVGTPLLILPVFALAQSRWSPQDIYLFVAAFGAMGHHLPGMIRAYGDRALFKRFRWRFVIAPVFLLVTCIAFYWWDLKGIILVVFFWGVWHGMMQTYGFCRIYDAKTGSFAGLNRRLDFWLCAIWFATAVVLSPMRMTDTLDVFYSSGGPFVQPWILHVVQRGFVFLALAVSILFVANFIWMSTQAKRPNPVKLVLLITSISFWWYCNNLVSNLLVGIALFEVFHDVQYLSLVWIYNRNRVEKDQNIGGFMRFIFRRSGSLVGLYLGLIFAYGSLAYFNSQLQIETIKRVLTGVVSASTLLHFYYDGFIWKVRESSTRQALGLSGGTADVSPHGIFHGWILHGAKWVAAFVVPLGALWIWQIHSSVPALQRTAWIVQDLPVGARQHYEYAKSLYQDGQLDAAAREFDATLKFDPKHAGAHYRLALLRQEQSKFDAAAEQYEAALPLDPRNADVRYDYSYTLERLGRGEEAAKQIAAALEINPNSPRALYRRSFYLQAQGKSDDAISDLRKAVGEEPTFVEARFVLAKALFTRGDLDAARSEFETVIKQAPGRADAMNGLGLIFLRQGQTSQAIMQFDQALELKPDFSEAAENLRIARARIAFPIAAQAVSGSTNSAIHLDLDSAWREIPHGLPTIDATMWGPRLRFSSSPRAVEQFYREVGPQLPQFVLYGSGDFHYLTSLLLRHAREPVTLVSFDNHPDWDVRPPRWCCGGWINRALELPHIRQVAIWGCGNFECWWPHQIFGNRKAERAGTLAVHPWADDRPPSAQKRRGAILRENWREQFEKFTVELIGSNIYVTIDLDCLGQDYAWTNWESGRFDFDDVRWGLEMLRKHAHIVGGDMCGAYSAPIYARRKQRWASEIDHPKFDLPSAETIRKINRRAFEALWPALTAPPLRRTSENFATTPPL